MRMPTSPCQCPQVKPNLKLFLPKGLAGYAVDAHHFSHLLIAKVSLLLLLLGLTVAPDPEQQFSLNFQILPLVHFSLNSS